MRKIQFAVDHNPTTQKYGIVTFEKDDNPVTGAGIRPVGPQDFDSEQAATGAFERALGNAIAAARMNK